MLCACEFNSRFQWSPELFETWAKAVNQARLSKNKDQFTPLKLQTNTHIARTCAQKSDENDEDDVVLKTCFYCHVAQPLDQFGANHFCDTCEEFNPHLAMLGFRTRTTNNNHKIKKYISDITLSELYEIWNRQRGRCAYSDIKLKLVYFVCSHDFAASLERIDTKKGYTKDNVCFIWKNLNSADRSAQREEQTEGSSGWTRAKVDHVINLYNERKRAAQFASA